MSLESVKDSGLDVIILSATSLIIESIMPFTKIINFWHRHFRDLLTDAIFARRFLGVEGLQNNLDLDRDNKVCTGV